LSPYFRDLDPRFGTADWLFENLQQSWRLPASTFAEARGPDCDNDAFKKLSLGGKG
jgi:hypothetical protein